MFVKTAVDTRTVKFRYLSGIEGYNISTRITIKKMLVFKDQQEKELVELGSRNNPELKQSSQQNTIQ